MRLLAFAQFLACLLTLFHGLMANVISNIHALWPADSTFSALAPWLSNVDIQVGADNRISLTMDDKDMCTIDTLGAGYIIFPADKTPPVVGYDSLTRELSVGDKIALVAGPEISNNSHLLSVAAAFASEQNFCENLIAIFAMKQNAQRAIFCGQVTTLKNARNTQQAFNIHNTPTPAKPKSD
ncbi:hypothetical protein PSACC_03642 [Paramicrosporidium saccamoebae]|uniref:Uncharacterized protein n=1 Tax=Paramicrosporidium saccamoebae TaxID=1246581 RepID=A0A2H9TFJ7_9FUNG|nr:hypothetical protein PSACC_03642 [Paramicrosporidium saccamoebae]